VFSRSKNILLALVLILSWFPCVIQAAEAAGDSEQIKEQATAALERIMRAISEGDYVLYTRDFSKRMKDSQDRESFLQLQSKLQRSLGKFKSMEYLGSYVQYGGTITLFKARFSKEKEDVLIKLVVNPKKSPPQITGLWFDSPALEK
jgi:hypothetical protein